MIDGQFKRWSKIRNAFNDFSKEDVFTLRKAIVLQNVNTYWELGLIHIANLQLLSIEFSYDAMLVRIYHHLLDRVDKRMNMLWEADDHQPDLNDFEYMFKDQPFLYNENISEGHINTVSYDVHKCFYKHKLQLKHSKLYDVIEDMIMMGG